MRKQTFLPYVAVVMVQLTTAGMSLLSKAIISDGMKPAIFVTYIQGIAFLFLAPFAFFLERKVATPLTFKMLCKICVISTLGMSLSFNFWITSFNYASATFSMAMGNTVPAVVFIMAISLRLERVSIRKWYGKAQVLGCAICISGAMVFTFFKGPAMYHITGKEAGGHSESTHDKEDWVKGFFFMCGYVVTLSCWFIAQGPIQKEYSAQLRLTTLQCLFSCIASGIWAAATQRNISSWKLGWGLNVITVFYSGIIISGINYWLDIWIVEKKGSVFACMFGPVSLVVTAFLSALIFKEILHWGSILGAIMLVGGLYSFLWGKHREEKSQNGEEKPKQQADGVVLESITTSTTEWNKKEMATIK